MRVVIVQEIKLHNSLYMIWKTRMILNNIYPPVRRENTTVYNGVDDDNINNIGDINVPVDNIQADANAPSVYHQNLKASMDKVTNKRG